jgi:hypothetical protein
MLKDRVRAARIGAGVVTRTASEPGVAITAGVFSATSPGRGTITGAKLGQLLK